MYISDKLKDQIIMLVKYGCFRDEENPDHIADEVRFEDGKILLTFIDYTGTTHECWEDEDE